MLESPFNETSREDFDHDENADDGQKDDEGQESHQEDEKDFDGLTCASQKLQTMERKPYLFYPDEKFKIGWDLFITL